jgi:hypothetical protein
MTVIIQRGAVGAGFWSVIGPHACGMVDNGAADQIRVTATDRWFFAHDDFADEHHVVGFGCLRTDANGSGRLCHNWVSIDFRGRGIARALTQARIACAISERLPFLTTVAAPMLVPMFTNLGFLAIGQRGKYTRMRRDL